MAVLLKVTDLAYKRKRREKFLFEKLNFEVSENEKVAVYGGISTGKTELFDTIAGLKKAKYGKIEKTKEISVVMQDFSVYKDLTVLENLEFFCTALNADIKEVKSVLENTGLYKYTHVRSYKLPNGVKKMLQIGCAMFGDFKLLVMDEPDVSFDREFSEKYFSIIDGLAKKGKGIIVMTSNENNLNRYDKVINIAERLEPAKEEMTAVSDEEKYEKD